MLGKSFMIQLKTLVMSFYCSGASSVENTFSWKAPGFNVSGNIMKKVTTKSLTECGVICSQHFACTYYEYLGETKTNCVILRPGANTFSRSNEGKIYQKDCTYCDPVYHHGFESTAGFISHGAQLVPGLVSSNALKTIKANSEWADFGSNLAHVCITRPETCTEGGTMAVWIKVQDCDSLDGILSSYDAGFTGFYLRCWDANIYVAQHLPDGYFTAQSAYPSGWFHLLFLYHGSNPGEGVTLYFDAVNVASSGFKHEIPFSTGLQRFVIGKILYVDDGTDYASVELDELNFWDWKLSEQEIQELYHQQNSS